MNTSTTITHSATVARRLLLAKEFYLNAVEQCRSTDSLSRLLAVHNFHIAIEITLKAILLEHSIRGEKTLNIDFEQMLADIDNHPPFKATQKRLPLRQELRNINQQRNLAQHHVVEPHENALSDCRFFCYQFLVKAFDDYFGTAFDGISRLSFINDETLKALAEKANSHLRSGNLLESVCASSVAFLYSKFMLHPVLPRGSFNSTFFVEAGLRHSGFDSRPLTEAIRKTHERIEEGEMFSAIIGSGVSLARLNHFYASVPHTTLLIKGHPWFESWQEAYSNKDAEYALEFVVDCIVRWQSQGLSFTLAEDLKGGVTDYLDGKWPKDQRSGT